MQAINNGLMYAYLKSQKQRRQMLWRC